MLVSACVSGPMVSERAICRGTQQERVDLAAALVDDPTEEAVLAGDLLIRKLDAGCQDVE